QHGIKDMEVCVHRFRTPDDWVATLLHNNVVTVPSEPGNAAGGYMLSHEAARGDMELFAAFRFPLVKLTKLEMAEIARDMAFEDLLELTWFCHQPTRVGSPCGRCNPCKYTIKNGLQRRVPAWNRRFHARSL